MRTNWRVGVVAALLAGAAASFVAAAWLSRRAHVDAVETVARVARDLSVNECAAGRPVRVSFEWLGTSRSGDDQATCARDYRAGEPITIFVASNHPSNIGPTREWILEPSTHDPFEVGGPNDLPAFVALPGVGALVGAALVTVFGFRARRRPAQSRVG